MGRLERKGLTVKSIFSQRGPEEQEGGEAVIAVMAGSKLTKGMAILLEILQKGLSNLLSSPLRSGIVRSHSGNVQREGWWRVDEVKRVEGSGNSARKDVSQSQVPPQNPWNPHRATPR